MTELKITRSDIKKRVKLNYHEYKERRNCYVGETDSIARPNLFSTLC